MLNFKFNYRSQNRRCMIAENPSYGDVMRHAKSLYSSFVFTDNHVLRWEDDEADKILVSSDAELSCALATMDTMRLPVFKFDIVLNSDSSDSTVDATSMSGPSSASTSGFVAPPTHAQTNASTAHLLVTCDECGCSPITGVRFKCAVRHDFDLCGACESKVAMQPYPMVKLYVPSQTWCGGDIPQYGRAWARSQRAHAQARGKSPAPAPFSANAQYNYSVHHGVACDECGCNPIHGSRFKCTVRNDFDLCAVCESKTPTQPFPMMKLYTPEQVQYFGYQGPCYMDQCPGQSQVPGQGCDGDGAGSRGRRGGGRHPRWINHLYRTGQGVADFTVDLSNSAIHVVAHALDGIHRKQNRGGKGGNAQCAAPSSAPAASIPTAAASSASPRVSVSPASQSSGHSVVECETGSAPAAQSDTPVALSEFSSASLSEQEKVKQEDAEMERWNDECLQEAIECSIRSLAVAPKSSNGGDFSSVTSMASLSQACSSTDLQSEAQHFEAQSEYSETSTVPPSMCVTVVSDVTYPSGAVVEAGARFKKIWLVRNSGSVAWPEDTFLRVTSSPSALLCEPDTRVHIGKVGPGEEVQVGVNMYVNAPEMPEGQHCNYINVFCLASERDDSCPTAMPAETVFSDLLFLDVNLGSSVSCDTAVSTSNILAAGDCDVSDAASSAVDNSPVPDDTSEAGSTGEWEVLVPLSPLGAVAATTATANDTPALVSLDDEFRANTGAVEVEVTEVEVDEEEGRDMHEDDAAGAAAGRWSHEIATLGEMGFSDEAIVVPLLQRLVFKSKTELLTNIAQNDPAEADIQIANRAHSESLQAVVLELLASSGAFPSGQR